MEALPFPITAGRDPAVNYIKSGSELPESCNLSGINRGPFRRLGFSARSATGEIGAGENPLGWAGERPVPRACDRQRFPIARDNAAVITERPDCRRLTTRSVGEFYSASAVVDSPPRAGMVGGSDFGRPSLFIEN